MVLPLTWSWLGGFFQAEGYISARYITLVQTRGDSLDLIRNFLALEVPELCNLSVKGPHICGKDKYGNVLRNRRLYIGRKESPMVLTRLLPYLRYGKRVDATKVLKLTNSGLLLPFDDDWIAGFWEGDGSIRLNSITFIQKNTALLKDIERYIGFDGKMYGMKLLIAITKPRVNRLGEILSRVRSSERLAQLDRV